MLRIISYLFWIIFFLTFKVKSQSLDNRESDSTKHTQYKRGIELQDGNVRRNIQTYEEKYIGKKLAEEKKRLFPLKCTSAVWTELNPKVPRVDYLGINFVNPDTGWAVGDLGTLIKTTDGGDSWEVEETNTTTPILKVRSYNGQIVIASGFNGLILRSTDGGETFTQIPSGVTGDLWGLKMINDTLGWACGNSNSFIKTTNGGVTWQVQSIPGYSSDLWWIDFLNENYGFICGNDGKVFKTTDGGNNWQIIQTVTSNYLFSIDLIDSLHIAAAGDSGSHIYSSDGGETWQETPMYQLLNGTINCVKYVNYDTGYVAVNDFKILYKTTDRGETWQLDVLRIGEYEIQFFPEEKVGYSAGTGLTILKAKGDFDTWNKAIINDDFTDVYFTSTQKGFAISSGMDGRLYSTTNSGVSWDSVPGAPGGSDLLFLDSLTGFIGSNLIYKTTDGGENWFLPNVPGDIGSVRKIFFINRTIGWATTDWTPTSNSKILKTTDAGENWFLQLEDGIDGFTSICFIDSMSGWATSRYIWQTTNGGNNWVQRTDIHAFFSDDVYFMNSDNGWISSYSSISTSLFRTADGGGNWIDITEVNGAKKFFLFPNPKHWIILGFSRYYITNDYGMTWTEFTNDVPTGIVSFNAVLDYRGFAIGNSGLILSYLDPSYVPVELVNFSFKYENEIIRLTWSTASELNNLGFEILRSNDKISWVSRGFVNGNGTTTLTHCYQFTDKVEMPDSYYYKLKQIDFNGGFDISNVIQVDVNQPLRFKLYQNFPNPFNPVTKINFSIPIRTFVKIILYDVTGREIKKMVDKEIDAGNYTVELNSETLSSGVYFYEMTTGSGFASVKKLIIIK